MAIGGGEEGFVARGGSAADVINAFSQGIQRFPSLCLSSFRYRI